MPADIRAFFGGKVGASATPPSTASSKKKASPTKTAKKGRKKVVESDSDDEFAVVKKLTPKKTIAARPKPEPPKETATTASAYFSNSAKPKRPDTTKPKRETSPPPNKTTALEPSKNTNGSKATKPKTYVKHESRDDMEDLDNDDDVFVADFKKAGRGGDDYQESESEEEVVKPRRKTGRGLGASKDEDEDVEMKDVDSDDDFVVPDDDEAPKARKGTRAKKRKSDEMEVDDDEEEAPKKGRGRPKKTTAKATPTKARAKKTKPEPEVDAEVEAILDAIPLIRPPTPPPALAEGQKWNPSMIKGNRAAPAAAGSKDLPEGAENCLAGMSFVFTGVLQTLEREAGQELVKRYGGKVTGAPSGKTSYVVLGEDAGPSKLRKIEANKLKTINEDGLFALIRTLPANGGSGPGAKVAEAQRQKEEDKAKQAALEMEAKEKEERKKLRQQQITATKASGDSGKAPIKPQVKESSKLWTVKYAPTQLNQIVGNKAPVERLQRWLANFSKNARMKFKLAGSDGSGTYRAVIIHGPPGIGKTTAAHLVAKLEGYDIVESNASDTRSKRMVEDGLKGVLSTTSLLGYFAGDGKAVEQSKRKLVLIMDEVDGMSAGDRGGVGALAAMCKKTSIPMILICNERRLPKMRPFDNVAFEVPFRRPTTEQIRGRMMTVAFREKMKIPPTVLNALIEGTGADIRQVVNMLSTVKVDEDESMDYAKGKQMSKAWEKHIVLKPFDITSKILGGGLFAPNSTATLNDKIELYFNDHEMSSLMLQENYLGTQPILANGFEGREKSLKALELVSKAADSISDGDLVDRMIHGSQQQWSLMPTHAVFSFVRPASYISGSLAYGSTGFTSWLGNFSKQNKLTRMVREIQGHMRLRSSADRYEVRQSYMPMFWTLMPKRLMIEGKEAAGKVIDLMDSYYLTKDDYDAIQELGLGRMDEKHLKIETAAKSAFTRVYNSQSHPLPFMKASQVFAPKKAAKDVPDLEEAIEAEEVEEKEGPTKEEEDEADISKDKYIKAPKPKKKAAASKKRSADSDVDDSEPKKAKASASKAKGKAKPKAKK
ncbi:DNA replication factor C, large subunit [Microthyrium microscopicum]|uniref:Replication factor C subunit 1 n=1 Tax=Microthyrium microscopicum TaxID=703497 RepID=A0A6A6U658_9PEZI|nr:DNA replication factor C, large subunit [Microthyrium microscopicum]